MPNQTTISTKPARETNRLQRDLDVRGYTVVRDILSAEQVRTLRQAMKRHMKSSGWYNFGGKFQVQAMHAVPAVADILTSDAVLRTLKEITHPFDVMLTGECDIMVNTTSTWHKDITHHPIYVDDRIFRDEKFRVYKIAFYLQDQDENSRATLKVRPMSHLRADGTNLPVERAIVRAGDAVVFDVRIDHVGQFPTFTDRLLRRGFEGLGTRLPVDAQKAFSRARAVLRWPRLAAPDRMAAFVTFGPSAEWTVAYADGCRHRHAPVAGEMAVDVLSHLAANHVSVLRDRAPV